MYDNAGSSQYGWNGPGLNRPRQRHILSNAGVGIAQPQERVNVRSTSYGVAFEITYHGLTLTYTATWDYLPTLIQNLEMLRDQHNQERRVKGLDERW